MVVVAGLAAGEPVFPVLLLINREDLDSVIRALACRTSLKTKTNTVKNNALRS